MEDSPFKFQGRNLKLLPQKDLGQYPRTSQCLFKIPFFFVELNSVFRALFVHFLPAFIMTSLNDITQTTSFFRIFAPAHVSNPIQYSEALASKFWRRTHYTHYTTN